MLFHDRWVGPTRRRVAARLVLVGLALSFGLPVSGTGADMGEASVDFEKDVRPIFARSCQACHGSQKQRGGLRLDSRSSTLAGGDSGTPAVVPGDVGSSALIERISTADTTLRMPPRGRPLTSEQVATLERWVAHGAPWAESRGAEPTANAKVEMKVTEVDRDHWAFRPLEESDPPATDRSGPAPNPIDRFLLATLEAKGLGLSAESDRRTLIRRLGFDLVGLPPSPEEVATFVADAGPGAYEKLVDCLLASPHFGERWGRHWLDVARHADSDGYETDLDRKAAFRYRDFVIRALNDDMPYDMFVRWQVAGDEYEPTNPMAVVATGFCTAAPSQETTPADTDENKAKIRYDELDNMVSTIGSGLLGLTLGCARCHDHKFDPIPTRDYYRLLSSFTTAERREAPLSRPHRDLGRWKREQRRLYREDKMVALGLSAEEKTWLRQPEHFFVPVQIQLYKKYGKVLEPSEEQLVAWMTEPRRRTYRALQAAAARARAAGAEPSITGLMLLDRGAVPEVSYLLGRGGVTSRVEVVTPGFLQALTRGATPEDYLKRARSRSGSGSASGIPAGCVDGGVLGTTYRRMALAEWLTDPEHGAGALLARVIVNRIWQHHFGVGLVRTPDDFGLTGDRPDHAELLDWLGLRLIRGGWRLKPIHRMIVTSAVYRQGSSFEASKAAIDPEDRLLWRRRPIRLEAEAIRDAMLAVSGRLVPSMYGPPFRPIIPAVAISTRSKDAYPSDLKDGPQAWRRSVYAFLKRSVPDPLSEAFDAPESTATCGRRNATSVPTQSLALLNDPFIRGCARDLAARVAGRSIPSPGARVERAYELALGRPPRDDERKAALEFLSRDEEPEALIDLCHVLFTLNEFLTID